MTGDEKFHAESGKASSRQAGAACAGAIASDRRAIFFTVLSLSGLLLPGTCHRSAL
jgi:hypothetical protein